MHGMPNSYKDVPLDGDILWNIHCSTQINSQIIASYDGNIIHMNNTFLGSVHLCKCFFIFHHLHFISNQKKDDTNPTDCIVILQLVQDKSITQREFYHSISQWIESAIQNINLHLLDIFSIITFQLRYQLYKSQCRSVGLSVCRSVGPQ